MMFDPVFPDPPLLLSPIHLLIVQRYRGHSAHAQFNVYCYRVFFLLEGACDQHKANQHCPDRGSVVLY
ncbi:unnamed protein product, partial [Staurois parvus]